MAHLVNLPTRPRSVSGAGCSTTFAIAYVLVLGSTNLCRAAVVTQHAAWDVDVAAMLKDVVINSTLLQLQRIRPIAKEPAEESQRVVGALQ